MKLHPTIRRATKRTLFALAAMLALLWIASIWWGVAARDSRSHLVQIRRGLVFVSYTPPMDLVPGKPYLMFGGPGFENAQFNEPIGWWFKAWGSRLDWYIDIPLWFPLAIVLAPAIALHLADRKARRREALISCATCGYSRTGLNSAAPCPECGNLPLPEGAGRGVGS